MYYTLIEWHDMSDASMMIGRETERRTRSLLNETAVLYRMPSCTKAKRNCWKRCRKEHIPSLYSLLWSSLTDIRCKGKGGQLFLRYPPQYLPGFHHHARPPTTARNLLLLHQQPSFSDTLRFALLLLLVIHKPRQAQAPISGGFGVTTLVPEECFYGITTGSWQRLALHLQAGLFRRMIGGWKNMGSSCQLPTSCLEKSMIRVQKASVLSSGML